MPYDRGMKRFALILSFTKDNERRLQVRPAHRDYLRGLFEQGRLEMSGPWANDTGGLVIYLAEDEADARAMLADDPYTKEGVVEATGPIEWSVTFPPASE